MKWVKHQIFQIKFTPGIKISNFSLETVEFKEKLPFCFAAMPCHTMPCREYMKQKLEFRTPGILEIQLFSMR